MPPIAPLDQLRLVARGGFLSLPGSTLNLMPTERTGRGQEIREIPPGHCGNGHPLTYPNVQVNYRACRCVPGVSGHRAYRCWTCDDTVYDPPHDGTEFNSEQGRWL